MSFNWSKNELTENNTVVEAILDSISSILAPRSYQDCIGFLCSADLNQTAYRPRLIPEMVALAPIRICNKMVWKDQRRLSCGWIDEGRSLSHSLTKIMPGFQSIVCLPGAGQESQPMTKNLTCSFFMHWFRCEGLPTLQQFLTRWTLLFSVNTSSPRTEKDLV